MDPDACLNQIRALVATNNEVPLDLRQVDHLCELIDGLDHWMSKGGFLPKDWRKAQ